MGENRNLIIFGVFAVGVLLLYQIFVLDPIAERERAARAALQPEASQEVATPETPDTSGEAPSLNGGPAAATPGTASGQVSRDVALARSGRIAIRTPALDGTLSLTGARFDDLRLLRYDTTVDSDEPVTLFNPEGSDHAYYAINGWAPGAGAPADLPGPNTVWTQIGSGDLTPDTPVTLQYRTADLVFERIVSVDEDYMFTVTDSVRNEGSAPVTMARFGLVRRHGTPAEMQNFFILHEGPVGVVGDAFFDRKYKPLIKDQLIVRDGTGGWLGMADKYWLAAVAPAGSPQIRGEFRVRGSGDDIRFETNYIRAAETIAPGATLSSAAYVFAGSKNVNLLRQYADELGIPRFDMAVDWGMFWFLTRPFFSILNFLNGILGNYGLAIMGLVIGLKLLLFPLNNRAFASMAKMRAVGPKMQEIRERFEADKQRQQKEIMELYKREKINPVAGCLPILPQIPIFFALYKTVFISLEIRHEPFFGWISDMSASDPTTFVNLFGLLPFDPSGWPIIGTTFHIGIWPLLMGLTMWAQQSLNPPPPDPMQRRIFAFLPVIFTIMMAQFAAALVIYWTWNNFLTIVQQYIIMRRHGTETEFDKLIAKARLRLTGSQPKSGEGD